MKKPLLFALFVWLVLFAIPTTRGQAGLDWKSATLERLSGFHPAWAPRDPPYQPEKEAEMYRSYVPPTQQVKDDVLPDVAISGLSVAPQFASLAGSSDRDVLLWCALSASEPKMVTRNLATLSRRFPSDANVLASLCVAQMDGLNLTTRVPGPLTSYAAFGWSIQAPGPSNSSSQGRFKIIDGTRIDYGLRPQWDALALQVRRGQQLEPNNGFWWGLEMICLLGARRDEAIWPVLRVGSHKLAFDDHSTEKLLSLRRAHLKTQGDIPLSFYLQQADAIGWMSPSQWIVATQQMCENIIGKRLMQQHKTALEGGRDLMLMGRLLRRSKTPLSVMTGISIESIALRNALPRSISGVTSLRAGFSLRALATHPRSLLRYANEQKRTDIARQIIGEWKVFSRTPRKSLAVAKSLGDPGTTFTGVSDELTAGVGGIQNISAMLVQTLPIPLLALALLSLLTLARRQRDEPFAIPRWTRGLGWSAFALLVLLGAQLLFNGLVWQFMALNFSGTSYFNEASFWGFSFILPRLSEILPSWAFAFPACVAGVGAFWGTMFAARRAWGDVSLVGRLRLLFSSPDDRVGVVNLEPLVQIIGLTGLWGVGLILLGLWFFLPQKDGLEDNTSNLLHDQLAGVVLMLFSLMTIAPALFFRTGHTGFRAYSLAWLHIARRFLVAHIALTTTLYLLLAIAGAIGGARFEAQWLKAHAPSSSAVIKSSP